MDTHAAMSLFHILAILLTASAIFSYINYRFLKLPTTIGIMLAALCFSLLLNLLEPVGIGIEHEVQVMLKSIDFDATLLHGMLSFLLFAGALHVDLSEPGQAAWCHHRPCHRRGRCHYVYHRWLVVLRL